MKYCGIDSQCVRYLNIPKRVIDRINQCKSYGQCRQRYTIHTTLLTNSSGLTINIMPGIPIGNCHAKRFRGPCRIAISICVELMNLDYRSIACITEHIMVICWAFNINRQSCIDRKTNVGILVILLRI